MYQQFNNQVAISVNDWMETGLTRSQFEHDSKRGFLRIIHRSTNGNTLIDVRSIQRPERLRVIEAKFGKVGDKVKHSSTYEVELDGTAREYYVAFRKVDGSPLSIQAVEEYTNRASILNALKNGLQKQQAARAKAGKRMKMGEFYADAVAWYNDQLEKYPCTPMSNARSFERLFKQYLNDGYEALIHGNQGNDNSRVVSKSVENLLLSLWRMNEKPFIKRVHRLYLEFISGEKELHDRETGEVFNPSDFRHKGRGLEITEATVWNYLKEVVNETSIYADRNGNFDYVNRKRPKHQRKLGQFSLSKISMDDVALSRQSVRGWVYKYMAVDVVSGYWFRPAYVVGKPNHSTVIESFRNMFCELQSLGMPMPGELEVEYHLMKDLTFLNKLFPFVRFCESPTEKRAEHAIKAFKYGASKDNGHTRGRWYANHEAFRSVRNKIAGDYVVESVKQPTLLRGTIQTNNHKADELQPQTIVADDLKDIEDHNNALHPLQKTYPGMTRKQVFMSQVNPKLKPVEQWYLYKFIGNETETSIVNNDFVNLNGTRYNLVDFDALDRLQPNNAKVTAYWLPDADGVTRRAYLWQGETYIGQVTDRMETAYNENAFERDEDDEANMLAQAKRISQYDKKIKERRASIPKIGTTTKERAAKMAEVPVDIIQENEQPAGYESDELDTDDWAARALNRL